MCGRDDRVARSLPLPRIDARSSPPSFPPLVAPPIILSLPSLRFPSPLVSRRLSPSLVYQRPLLLSPSLAASLAAHITLLIPLVMSSTHTLRSLAAATFEDSSLQQDVSDTQEPHERSDFKLIGLRDSNASKPSIARVHHKRHPDPSTRLDTKSRLFGTSTPSAQTQTQPATGENADPGSQAPTPAAVTRRNPVTGQGLTPVEQMSGRTHNLRNKSSITFMSPE